MYIRRIYIGHHTHSVMLNAGRTCAQNSVTSMIFSSRHLTELKCNYTFSSYVTQLNNAFCSEISQEEHNYFLAYFLPQYYFTFLSHCNLIDNIFSVTIQHEEGKFISQGIPEVQEKNLQFIDSSSEMSDPCENATKRVRR